MLTTFETPINKFTSTKFWYYTENILIVSLLFFCIKSLTDYDNVYYQTWKNEAAAKAILAFTAIVFIIRKVKLLNWQSLVATLIFGAVVLERMHFWADSEDILAVIKPQMATEWLSLMIIIDMVLYKNINNIFKSVNYLLILYVLMTIGMFWRRHDRMDPIILVFPMFLFALVKIDEEKKEWFMRRFIDGWFISFVYIMVKSFTERPYEGYRYYGCFLNIGQFGIFMVCNFVIAISSFIYLRHRYGKRNIAQCFSIVWILVLCYMFYLIETRTIMVGVLFCLIWIYIYIRKNTSRKIIRRRWIIIFFLFIVACAAFVYLMKISLRVSDVWIVHNIRGPISPIVHTIYKFKSMASVNTGNSLIHRIYDMIDDFSSKRLTIISEYAKYFNYDGNGALGIQIDSFNDYWAYVAHNTYVQFIVEYGYVSAFEIIILSILALIQITKKHLSSGKKIVDYLPMLWLATTFGVWLGESSTFFYPITFFGMMFIVQRFDQDKTN